MSCLINLSLAIFLTGLTGGILLLVWKSVGWLLDRMGYLPLVYRLL